MGRRLLCYLTLVAIVAVVLVMVHGWYSGYRGRLRLAAAIAEADRLDPGWRLQQLEAKRREVTDEENGALVAARAVELLKDSQAVFHLKARLKARLKALPPPVALTREQAKELRQIVKNSEPAIVEGRKLIDYSWGRFAFAYAPDIWSTRARHLIVTESLCHILYMDVVHLADDGDYDMAAKSCLAMLNISRLLGDEPLLISPLQRMILRNEGVDAVERLLAQGELREEPLRRLQTRLAKEKDTLLLLHTFRAQRAWAHALVEAIKKGRVSQRQAMGMDPSEPLLPRTGIRTLDDFVLWITRMIDAARVQSITASQHAAILEYCNQAVEIAKLPVEEQFSRLTAFNSEKVGELPLHPASPTPRSSLRNGVARSVTMVVMEFDLMAQMRLRCALAAVAAERFRLAHGRWPKSLDELVPQWLDQVPTDVFNGQPIRMNRLGDGIVIYSVGKNGVDEGGHQVPSQRMIMDWPDVGFRLWDVKHRKQPPPAEN